MNPSFIPTLHHSSYPAISPDAPQNSAVDKVVAITGGVGGIGYSIAQAFSAAGAATVIILARRQYALDEAKASLDEENRAAGRSTEVWTYQLDIQDAKATHAAFASIRHRLNGGKDGDKHDVDILVANAAALMQGSASLDFEAETYRSLFETNVMGNLNLVRAFLAPEAPAIPFITIEGKAKSTAPYPHPEREKVILDVSTSAWMVDWPGQAAYSASKLAFTRIMHTLQTEVSKIPGMPIRVHSFHPGLIKTPGSRSLLDVDALDVPWDDVSLASHFAVWLASSAAAFLTGRFVTSDLDVEELMAEQGRFAADPHLCTVALKV